MNSNIDAISLNDLFSFYWNMNSVFHIKDIHEKYCLGPLKWFFTNPIQGREFKSYGGSKGGLKPCKTGLIWKKITRVKCNQSDLQETLSVPVIVTIKIYSKAHRRNNQIEFQWYVDTIRMITQIFTTPQKFWSLDQPLHPVP